jgi:predicted nucleotidyltransferase
VIRRSHETSRALKKLRSFAGPLRARGATSLYLFGSTARNKAAAKSDQDLFIDYDPRGKFNAFDLVASKRLLQRGLGVSVDLTTRKGLHPLIRKRVEAEATRVF